MSVTRVRAVLAAGMLATAAVVAALIVWLPVSDSGNANSKAPGVVTRLVHGNADGEIEDTADLNDVSPVQASALADGYVTRTEYEASVGAAFSCIQDSGYQPRSDPRWNVGGTALSYEFVSEGDGRQAEVMLDCEIHHLRLVAFSWVRQNAPGEAQLVAGEVAMRDCLITGGLPEAEVRGAARFQEFEGQDDGGLYGRCIREVSEEFGLGWSAN